MVRTMRNLVACCGLVLFALATAFAAHGQSSAAEKQSGLVITASGLCRALSSGGTSTSLWPRLEDQPHTRGILSTDSFLRVLSCTRTKGEVSGTPTIPGEYRFTVAVADSSAPPLQVQRAMTITVIAGLTIDWKQYPKVQGTALSGSVVVTNQTGQEFDLTVVVVAVNSIGRATTLGYQHFTLAGEKSSPVIPFGSSPGLGTYVVHADAVAHHPSGHRHHIYRARKQTSEPLPITQN